MGRVLPILFNTDMVRAILDKRKTVTRRVVKYGIKNNQEISKNLKGQFEIYDVTPRCGIPKGIIIKPPYKPGDILYVRETWQYAYELDWNDNIIEETGRYIYAADNPNPFNDWVTEDGTHRDHMPWKPSIHMPKAAARIWLKITDVRAERLQDITEYQIVAEGTPYDKENYEQWGRGDIVTHNAETYLRGCFRELWNSTIKKSDFDSYGWGANPFAWVIEFERCEKPRNEG